MNPDSLENYNINFDKLYLRLAILHNNRELQLRSVKGYVESDKFKGDGWSIYQETLNEICNLLKDLSSQDRFKENPLFVNSTKPEWQELFKNNFYKLFIDRPHCKIDLEPDEAYLQFNQIDARDGYLDNSNLCYGEAFAVAFFAMLIKVAQGYEIKEPEDLIKLLIKFNEILICDFSKDDKSFWGKFDKGFAGSFLMRDLSEIRSLQISQKEFCGEMEYFYGLSDKLGEMSFDRSFDRRPLAREYIALYLKKVSSGHDAQELISELVNTLEFHIHLAHDGNGRSSLISGWFLAITQPQSTLLPIFYNYYDEKLALTKAKEWIAEFVDNPSIKMELDRDERILYSKSRKSSLNKIVNDNMAQYFLAELLLLMSVIEDDEKICLKLFLDLDKPVYVSSSSVLKGSVAISDKSYDGETDQYVSLKLLNEVILANKDLLDAEDLSGKFYKTANLYFKHICDNPDLELGESEVAFLKLANCLVDNGVHHAVKGLSDENKEFLRQKASPSVKNLSPKKSSTLVSEKVAKTI